MTQKLNIPEIVKNYSTKLSVFIRKRVSRLEDAEDILQDVFFQLSEAELLLKPIDQIASWLFTVARNRITDLYRKKKPLLLAFEFDDDEEGGVLEEMAGLLADVSNNPETQFLRSMVWTELESALAELPGEQREVFELTEIKGLSFNEIATLTEVPLNTLISRKRYAVIHLRERLYPVYNELIKS